MKRASINRILNELVMDPMAKFLATYGFKYKKTKDAFFLDKDGCTLEIYLYRYNYQFIYDSLNDEVFITFHLTTSIYLTEFNEWYKKEIDPDEEKIVGYTITNDLLFIKLNDNQYDQSDFSEHQHYPVTFIEDAKLNMLAGLGNQYERIDFIDFYSNILPLRATYLDQKVDLKVIMKNVDGLPNQQLYVPVYYNKLEYAKELFDKRYQSTLDYIENNINNNLREEEINEAIQALNEFIEFAKNTIDHTYPNPYKK